MALTGSQLDKLMKSIPKAGSEQLPSIASKLPSKVDTITSLTKQVANTSTRLANIGEDAKKITDTRNPLEKILNLTPDQNFIFDLFEIINRPQQALFGGIEAGVEGGDVLSGALTGLTGENKTSFKDVLKASTGSDLGDVEGQLDFVDVAGLVGDVLLDPADLALLMVTGGASMTGSIASAGLDVGKGLEAGADVAKAATESVDILGKVQDVLFGEGKRLAKVKFEDYVSAVVSSKARTKLGLEGASLTSMTMKSMGGAMKGVTQFSDAAFTQGFKMIDDSGELSKAYEGLKKGIEGVKSNAGQAIKKQVSLANEKFNTTMLMLRGVDTRYIDWLKTYAKETLPEGKLFDDWFGELNVKLIDVYEKKYGSKLLNPGAALGFMTSPTHSLPYGKNTLDDLFELFGRDNIEPFVSVKKFSNGIEYLEFDAKVFDEGSSLVKGLRDKIKQPKTVFDSSTRKAYEKTLKYSDSTLYEQYRAKVAKYESTLDDEVAKRFTKETGREVLPTTKKSSEWRSVKASYEAEMLNLGKHPQSGLMDNSFNANRYNVWLSPDERKAALAAMSPEDVLAYKQQIKLGKQRVSSVVTIESKQDAIERVYVEGDKFLRDKAPIRHKVVETEAMKATDKLNDLNLIDDVSVSDNAITVNKDGSMSVNAVRFSGDTGLESPRGYNYYMGQNMAVDESYMTESALPKRYGGSVKTQTTFEFNRPFVASSKKLSWNDDVVDAIREKVQYADKLKRQDASLWKYNNLFILNKGTMRQAYNEDNIKKFLSLLNDNIDISSGFGKLDAKDFDEILTNLKKLSPTSQVSGQLLDNSYVYTTLDDAFHLKVVEKAGYDGVIGIVNNKSVGEVIDFSKNKVAGTLEDMTFTDKLNRATRQGRVRMEGYKNEASEAYMNELLGNKVFTDGADKFKDYLHEAQRAVGWREFGDDEALLKMSFDGYATHGLNQSVKDSFEAIKQAHPEWANKIDFTVFMPGRTRALSARQTFGSTYETNLFMKEWYTEMFKKEDWVKAQFKDASPEFVDELEKFFTTNNMLAKESTASMFSFIDETYSAINKNNKSNQMLLAMSFGDSKKSGAAFQNLSSKVEVPTGYKQMNSDDVRNTIRTLESNMKFAGENKLTRDLVDDLKASLVSGRQPVVERHIYEMLKTTNEIKPKDGLKIIDAFNSMFKVGKTLNPAFNVKNLSGHMVNQWLAGVPMTSMFSYANRAWSMRKLMATLDDAIVKGGMDSLDETQKALFQTYQEFLDAGFLSRASVYALNDLDPNTRWTDPMSSQKHFTTLTDNFATRGNMQANLVVDNTARLSTYLYAKEHPEFIAKLGIDVTQPDSAMKAVRLVHFDPNDLTFFEDDVMKRLIPFYTFTRQNMAFQIKNLTRHSEKYNKLFKLYNSWNSNVMDLSPEEMQQYQREQFYIPVWKKQDGEFVTVKSSIPTAALTELTFDFGGMSQNVVSKLTPLLRAPFEAATGTQTFTGQPIERYAGELSTRIPLPYMTKSMEWLMSQSGLDTPIAAIAQTAKAGFDIAQGGSPEESLFKATSLLTSMNPQDTQISKLYNDIEALDARIQVLKSTGVELPTLEEIAQKTQSDTTLTKLSELTKINDLINNIKR